MTTAAATSPDAYPVRFDVAYPASSSRLLIFFRILLAIPHLIILYLLNYVLGALTFIAFLAILFTKTYPKGIFDLNVGILRWRMNVSAYLLLTRDEYPPFSFDAGVYPLTLEVDYPETLSRFAPLYKWLLAIPHLIVLVVLGVVAVFVTIIAWFAILFTGNYPQSLFDFSVGVQRWSARIGAYTSLMRDEYPPFSMDA